MRVTTENLKFFYRNEKQVLKGVTLEAVPGELTALIGPNAAGKSTLLKCIAGVEKTRSGITFHDGVNQGHRDRKNRISYLPQDTSCKALMTVFEAVLLGRLKNLAWHVGNEDLDMVMKALKRLSIDNLATSYLNELSGGQKQMVAIAQALVNCPKVLLLDEPTNSLDLRNELEILDQIAAITREEGITTIMAIHSVSLAARYADKVVILKDGMVHTSGRPNIVMTEDLVREVYGVESRIITEGPLRHIIPIGSFRK